MSGRIKNFFFKSFLKKHFLTQILANLTQIFADKYRTSATICVQSAGICVRERFFRGVFNLIVSICYIGYLPRGGGSVSALFGILFYLAIYKNTLIYFGILTFLIILGIILGNLAESIFNKKDPSRFVVDDFLGMLVALSFVPPKLLFLISAFLVFRFCDIVKIYPIRRLEALKGGWGIILDDLVAGLYANVFIRTVQSLLLKR